MQTKYIQIIDRPATELRRYSQRLEALLARDPATELRRYSQRLEAFTTQLRLVSQNPGQRIAFPASFHAVSKAV